MSSTADPRYASKSPQERLFIAARLGDLEQLKKALASRASPSALNLRGATALMMAAENNHPECALALLKVSDPNQATTLGSTALMFAAHAGSLECAQLLAPLSNPLAVTTGGCNAISTAAMSNQVEMIKALMSHHDESIWQAQNNQNPLLAAAVGGAYEALEHLAPTSTPLMLGLALSRAASGNKNRCARLLAAVCHKPTVISVFKECRIQNKLAIAELLLEGRPWLLNAAPRSAPLTDFDRMIARHRLILSEQEALAQATAPLDTAGFSSAASRQPGARL